MFLKILIYIIFLFFSLGQLGRISFYDQEVNLYAYDIFLLLTLLILVLNYRLKPIQVAFKKSKIPFLFIGSLLFSYIISIQQFTLNQNIISLLYPLRLIAYMLFFLYLHFHRKKQKREVFSTPLLLFFLVTMIVSFIQYFFYPDLRGLIYQGWDPHLNRMFGTFFDTSVAASVYGLSFFYLMRRMGNPLLAFLFLVSLVLTFSRASYLSFSITLPFFMYLKRSLKLGLLIFAFFVIVFFISPKQFGVGVDLSRTFSIAARLNDYKEGINLWFKHPLLGIGYNRIRYARSDASKNTKRTIPSHASASFSSSYLIILVTGGIIGLVLFLATLYRLMMINKLNAVLIIFASILSFFDNILLHPFIIIILGSFLVASNFNPSDRSRR